jgi:hypothetical protein
MNVNQFLLIELSSKDVWPKMPVAVVMGLRAAGNAQRHEIGCLASDE